MRPFRSLAGVFAALLSLALVSLVPAQAVAPDAGPLATTVSGACYGGPGRLSLTVNPPTAGKYQVEVTARGVAEGSRWRVNLDKEGTGSRYKDFRRVAVNGSWTVQTQFSAPGATGDDEVFFFVDAGDRGSRTYACFLFNIPTSPVVGLSPCNNPRRSIVLFARELDDDSTLVRSIVFEARPDSRWHLKLTATGLASRQVVEFDDLAGKRRAVTSRIVISGVKDPRLRMVATSENGGSCRIGLNPPNVTTDAPLKLQGLAKLGALRT